MKYIVFNEHDPNLTFYVEADDLETALHDALSELGWLIAQHGEEDEDLDEDEELFREFYSEFGEDDVDYN